MKVRDYARAILTQTDLGCKLSAAVGTLCDDDPGPAERLTAPARDETLRIRPGREVKVPALPGMKDRAQRARILHALANHELQAVELFAWALLAFPDAPPAFRQGLLHILGEEQRHTRMYIARVEACGARFGDYPVSGYFWNKVQDFTTPLHFVCAMSLTFENANLDHTAVSARAARDAGDEKTATVIDRVHRDEIEHVRFGWHWLQQFKPADQTPWDAYRAHLVWPLRPLKAKGRPFRRDGRVAAGIDDAFLAALEAAAE